MRKVGSILLSLGAAFATTKLAQVIGSLEVDDLLRPVGLSRRRSHWPENLAFLGAGVLTGGVCALLWAPASGEQTRGRIARKAGELGEATVRKAREVSEGMRDELGALTPNSGNGGASLAREAT